MTTKQQRTLALAFGVLFVVVMLGLALFIPSPTLFQQFVFRIVLGLAASGVATTIPGALDLKIRAGIRATGAIAVFALLYFFNPAELVTDINDGKFFELEIKPEPQDGADILVNPKPNPKGVYQKGASVRVDVLAREGWAIAKWIGPVESVEGDTGYVNMTGNLTILVRLEKELSRTPMAAVPVGPSVLATSAPLTRTAASPLAASRARPDRIIGSLTYRDAGIDAVIVALIESSECDPARVSQRTKTDQEGQYVFSGVAAGTYRIALNGWGSTGPSLQPYSQSCTPAVVKTDALSQLSWNLHKTDLSIVFPMDGTYIETMNPRFSWSAYPTAVGYEVVLIQRAPKTENIEWLTPVSSLSFVPRRPLISGGSYQLLVWARDEREQIAVGQSLFRVR